MEQFSGSACPKSADCSTCNIRVSRLDAFQDLRHLPHADVVRGLSFSALLQAPGANGHDDSCWRALSNLIGSEFPDRGLRSRCSWWAPRRSDAKLLGATRSLSSGSANAGGNLAIQSAVAQVAEAVRPRNVLEAAGAVRRELSSAVDDTVPTFETGNAGAWLAEGAVAADAGITVGVAVNAPKTCGATLDLSRLFVKNAVVNERDLATEIQRQVRSILEAGFFNGTGSLGQPLGLLNLPNAGAVSFAGSVPTYAELVDVAESYFDSDADPDGATFFIHPKTYVKLLEVEQSAGTGQYGASFQNGSRYILGGIKVALTGHLPEGKVILCDPRDLVISYWLAPEVLINPYSLDTSGSVRVTVFNTADIAARHRSQLVIGG